MLFITSMNVKKILPIKHAAFYLIKYYLWWALAIFCPALFLLHIFFCALQKKYFLYLI